MEGLSGFSFWYKNQQGYELTITKVKVFNAETMHYWPYYEYKTKLCLSGSFFFCIFPQIICLSNTLGFIKNGVKNVLFQLWNISILTL